MMPNEPYYAEEDVEVWCGDCRDMSFVASSSVALIVTSPPYWDIKNYRTSAQIGLGQSYEDYLGQIRLVGAECKRVLEPGRYMAWVIGTRVSDGEMKHIPADCIRVFGELGFGFKKEIIWVKPKGTQGLWQRGTTQFLKDKPYPCSANINIQHEYILLFQREGDFTPPPTHVLSEEFIKRVAWSVWELPVSMTKGHPAPFPATIPERLIELYSYPGEVVLDPFLGTGTTVAATRSLGRKGIGVEISEEYCALAVKGITSQSLRLYAEV